MFPPGSSVPERSKKSWGIRREPDKEKNMTMMIDAHSHGFHGPSLDQLRKAGGDWLEKTLDTLLTLTSDKPSFIDVDLRVEMLERNGIDLQVVTPGHMMDANLLPGEPRAQLALARALNDNMARLRDASKGKLLPMGSVPLADFEKGGSQELERAMKNLGLEGISLPTNLIGKPVDLPEFEPFWAKVAEMNVPIFLHPQDPVSHVDRPYEADWGLSHTFAWPYDTVLMLTRLVFSGIMEKYPTLKIISHHLGGGMIPFLWGRISESYAPDNTLGNLQRKIGRTFPKPLFEYFSRFYYDTAVGGSGPAIRCAYDVFGPDRIVFATDLPWGPGSGEKRLATYPNVITSLGFPEAHTQKIFEGNIRRILTKTI